MNDPRILNDPGMVGALEPVREIYAARLMIQDETANMSTAEKIEFLNRETEAFLAPMGKSLCYDLASQGKLKPRQPLTQ
jgi:hypothetical protein